MSKATILKVLNWLPDRTERLRRLNIPFATLWLLADVVLMGCGLWKWLEILCWLFMKG